MIDSSRSPFPVVFAIRPAHSPAQGAALTASMFCFRPCQKQAGGEPWGSVCKSAAGTGRPGPSVTRQLATQSLTHPGPLPVLRAPFTVSAPHRCATQGTFLRVRYVQMHKYRGTAIACSTQHGLGAQEHRAQVRGGLDHAGWRECTR